MFLVKKIVISRAKDTKYFNMTIETLNYFLKYIFRKI